MVPAKQNVTKCMVVSNSMLRNTGAEHADMIVECFPGIKTEQLYIVIEKKDLGSPLTVRNRSTLDIGVLGFIGIV